MVRIISRGWIRQNVTFYAGEVISKGGYSFEVMPTPGHTPEHACLVDRDRRLFIAGDHLIFAKPGMMQLAPDQHLLAQYIESLSVIRSFKLEIVFDEPSCSFDR